MRRAVVRLVGAVTLTVSSSACALSSSTGPATLAPATAIPVAVPSPLPSSPVPRLSPASSSNPDAAAAIAAAQADAAARQGISPADVHVEQVESHEWGDASLGCPEPNVQYLQMVTAGFLIVVTAGNKTLEYHSDARGRAVLCQER